MGIVYLVIVIVSAILVQRDAKKFREKGVNIIPGLWSSAVFLFWPIVFPLYLIFRFLKYKKVSQLGNPPLPPVSRIYNWLLPIIFIGLPVLLVIFMIVIGVITAKQRSANLEIEREKSVVEMQMKIQELQNSQSTPAI